MRWSLKKTKVTNTLMLKTSFWLPRIHGSWVADDTHQTSVKSSSTFKHLLQGLSPIVEKMGIKCLYLWYDMTACFTSAFAVNHSPSAYFLRGPSLDGNHCVKYWRPKLRLFTVIRLGGYGPHILQSRCMSVFLDPFESTFLAHVKLDVAFWSQSLDTDLFYTGIEPW